MNKITDLAQLYEVLKMIKKESGEVLKTPFSFYAVKHRPEAELVCNSV